MDYIKKRHKAPATNQSLANLLYFVIDRFNLGLKLMITAYAFDCCLFSLILLYDVLGLGLNFPEALFAFNKSNRNSVQQ